MTNLTTFAFDSQDIRFVTHPEGKYAFGIVAEDLATVLEHSNSRMMTEPLDIDYKGVSNTYTPGGTQSVNVIWEPGVYQLLSISRKPKAKPFQKWVFEKVLPSIRETGSYTIAKPTFQIPKTYGEALLEAGRLAVENEKLQEKIEADAPLVKLAETLTTKDKDVVSIGELAKSYEIGRNKFFDILREVGFIMHAPSRLPYQVHLDNGRAEVFRKERQQQPGVFDSVTAVTAKGQEYIAKKLNQRDQMIRTEVRLEATVDFEARKLKAFTL